MFHVPANEEVPLWQAVRVRGRSGPAVLQVEDDVWVRSLNNAHFHIDWFPQHFSDRVVCWGVKGAIRCFLCKQNIQNPALFSHPETY